jgi:hypothetical protein
MKSLVFKYIPSLTLEIKMQIIGGEMLEEVFVLFQSVDTSNKIFGHLL